jgi:hypothetical protein
MMNDLLTYFLTGSCGSFKKSARFGLNESVWLFIFICFFFMIGKILVYIVHKFILSINGVIKGGKSLKR